MSVAVDWSVKKRFKISGRHLFVCMHIDNMMAYLNIDVV